MELLNSFLNLLLAVWAIAIVESADDEHLVEEAFRLSLPPGYIRDKWLADVKKQKEADEKKFKKEILKAENKNKKNGVEFAYENHKELMESHLLELQQSSQKLSTAEQAKQMLGAIEAKFLLGQQLAKEEEWMLVSALASSLSMEGKTEHFLAILRDQIDKSHRLDTNGKERLQKMLTEIEGEMGSDKFKMAVKDVYGTNVGDGMAFRLALKALGVKMVDMTDEQVKLYFFYCRFYKNLLKLLMVEGPNGPKYVFLTSWLEKMVKLLDAEILAMTINNNDPFKLLGSAYDEEEEEREKANKKPSNSWAMWKTSSAKGKNTLEEEEKVQTKHEIIEAERKKRAKLWADLLEGN